MRILIDPGSPTCTNMGDVAMLQTAVARLRALWPAVEVRVLTDDPMHLASHCPDVIPASEAGRRAWCDGVHLPRVVTSLIPAGVRRLSWRLQHAVQHGLPGVYQAVLRSPVMCGRRRRAAINDFLHSMATADLYFICGQATLTDDDRARALRLLDSANLALAQGIPVVMFGQAIGPLTDPTLVRRASRVLPSVRLIAIREERMASQLLRSFKVSPDQIVLTGDDAVELAWNERSATPRGHLGVHLRMAPLAITDVNMLAALGRVLREAAQELNARLVPLPISLHARAGAYDPAVLKGIIERCSDHTDGGASIDTPLKVIAAAGTCRVVVTGAYHAAVFALSQGVPAICLGRSSYYLAKFHGLTDLFGPGCVVLDLRAPDYAPALAAAIRIAWARAEGVRESLIAAAERQVTLGRAAYACLGARLSCAADRDIAAPVLYATGGAVSGPALAKGVAS